MGDFVVYRVKLSSMLLKEVCEWSKYFGVPQKAFCGLLLKQVGISVKYENRRIIPPESWQKYREFSDYNSHLKIELETRTFVEEYAQKFMMHPAEVVRQFLVIGVEFLKTNKGCVPEDIPAKLFPKQAA